MHITLQSRLSPTALSVALVGLSALFFASVHVSVVAARNAKDILFESSPLWALLALVGVPPATLILAPCLVSARRGEGRRLKAIDWCALAAGAAPIAFVATILLGLFR